MIATTFLLLYTDNGKQIIVLFLLFIWQIWFVKYVFYLVPFDFMDVLYTGLIMTFGFFAVLLVGDFGSMSRTSLSSATNDVLTVCLSC